MRKKELNDYIYFIQFEFIRHNHRYYRSHLFMSASSLLRGVYHSINDYPELDKLSFSVIKVSDKNKSKTVLPRSLYLH
jgi:hypothetical protein